MQMVKELFQTADWKTEKHVPVIDSQDNIKKGEILNVTVSVGKQIPHPNTTEHHIEWIEVYFLPKDEVFPYCIGRFELSSHGASVQGPNTSTVFTQATVACSFKTEKSGVIIADSYCNIHGLWKSKKDIETV
ncbi:MAG: class II SORL domain-containing protein [Candidatus Omnitrophota bacterium]